jgi:hypothetical protein
LRLSSIGRVWFGKIFGSSRTSFSGLTTRGALRPSRASPRSLNCRADGFRSAGQCQSMDQICNVVEISELSRVRRRPRPWKELDRAARKARRALEREIYREPLIPILLRLPPGQLQRLDDERRAPAYGNVPSRCATIRQLLDEALMGRKSMRPRPSRVPRGTPYPIDV